MLHMVGSPRTGLHFSGVTFQTAPSVLDRQGLEHTTSVTQAGKELVRRLEPLVPATTNVRILYYSKSKHYTSDPIGKFVFNPLVRYSYRQFVPPKEESRAWDEADIEITSTEPGWEGRVASLRGLSPGWGSVEGFCKKLGKKALKLGHQHGVTPPPPEEPGLWKRIFDWISQ